MNRRVRGCLVAIAMVIATAVVGVSTLVEEVASEVRTDELVGFFLSKVPDASQPPPSAEDNWCTPMAVANAVSFLDWTDVDWASGVTGNLTVPLLSDALGYFLCTNGQGSPDRANAGQRLPGTLTEDTGPGISHFADWDGRRPPSPDLDKASYKWDAVWLDSEQEPECLWETYLMFLKEARVPPILIFEYWNPKLSEEPVKLEPDGEILWFAEWGDPIDTTLELKDKKVPNEVYNKGDTVMGHAVTGVGFLVEERDVKRWALVHDNWATTPENVAVPWEHIKGIVFFGGEPLFELLDSIRGSAGR